MRFKNILLVSVFMLFALYSFAQPKEGLRILYIGDSITDGNWGGGGSKVSSKRNQSDLNHIFGSGYMYLCAAHYGGNFPEKDYRFFNRGISGNSLKDIEKRWRPDVLDINPDVLSILVGINDVNRCIWDRGGDFDFEGWEQKYRNLMDTVLRQNPSIKLVICSPFVYESEKMKQEGNWETQNRLTRHCARIVESIAKDYNAVFVSFGELFDNLLKEHSQVKPSYWLWDGIHPTAAAHQRMADFWIDKAGHLLE